MFPIALDLTRVPILLAGSGELLHRRRKQLEEYGAARLTVKEIPSREDIENAAIVMLAGLPREQAEPIVYACHAAGKLVNVEDINELCDFYFTANVRRGDLVIAVSTGGASPTLARKIRDAIARMFGEEWAERVRETFELRQKWKAQGKDMREVMEYTEQHVKEKGWLDGEKDAA